MKLCAYRSILMLCAMSVASSVLIAQQATPQVLPIFVDYETPPSEMNRFVASVDAIVHARVERTEFAAVVDPDTGKSRDMTRYVVRVIEPLKLYPKLPSAGEAMVITRLGGQHTDNGRLVRTAVQGFPDFEQGSEYVLFLAWNAHTNDFDIAYGPDGAYQLAALGAVRALGHYPLAQAQNNKDRAAFLREIRGGA